MRKAALFFSLIAMLATLIACAPITKDDYIEDFAAFVDKVEEERNDYTSADWEKADTRYTYYSEKLYEKFEEDLALKDHFKVGVYKMRYEGYRSSDSFIDGWRELINGDEVSQLREEIKRYFEEDLEGDISALAEEAERMSKELGAEVEEIVRELEQEYGNTR